MLRKKYVGNFKSEAADLSKKLLLFLKPALPKIGELFISSFFSNANKF